MRLAIRKSAKHRKKITAIERKFPVYTVANELGADNKFSPQKIGSLGLQDSIANSKRKSLKDARYGEIMNFLDDIDEKFNLDDV